MGVSLSYIFSNRYPLDIVSEQVFVLPQKRDLAISSVGWPKIIYYFSGTAQMALDENEIYSVNPGETMILWGRRGQRYLAQNSSTPVRLHALIISFERSRGSGSGSPAPNRDDSLARYLAETFPGNRHLASGGASSLWNLAVRLRDACESPNPLREELACELATQFVFRVAEHAGLHRGVTLLKYGRLTREACDRALQKTSPPPVRREIAETLGVSAATLDRAFRESLGMPCAAYLDRVRIERAKSMLLSSLLPIARVAKMAHFGSSRAFCRAFKSATGLSPGKYRQGHQISRIAWNGAGKRSAVRRSASQRGIPEVKSWRLLALPAATETKTPSLLLCLEGAFQAITGGTKRAMGEDDASALVLAPGKTVECRPLKAGRTVALLIEGNSPWAALVDAEAAVPSAAVIAPLGAEGSHLQAVSDLPLLRAWLKEPMECSGPLHASLSVKSLIHALWWEAWGATLGPPPPGGAPDASPTSNRRHQLLIAHAKEFIGKHFARNLTLGEIAWSVGASEEHLARVFRTETGETVMGHRLGRRIYRAQSMLVRTQSPISKVAEACGFQSAAYFHRAFKQRVGCTPAAFRRKGVGALP